MYVILYEYILRNKVFRKLFNGEAADLSKCTIIYHSHKICDSCYAKFKEERRKCELCPSIRDVDYTLHCKPMLNLWNYRGFIIQTFSEYDQVVEGCKKFMDSKKKKVLLG